MYCKAYVVKYIVSLLNQRQLLLNNNFLWDVLEFGTNI